MVQALGGHVRLLCPSNFQAHGLLHKHQFPFQPQVVFVESTVLGVFVFSVGLPLIFHHKELKTAWLMSGESNRYASYHGQMTRAVAHTHDAGIQVDSLELTRLLLHALSIFQHPSR